MDKSEYYTLDSMTGEMTLVTKEQYFIFHEKLPKEKATALGIRIAREATEQSIVSTVFLGHPHGKTEKPLMFETMVVGGKFNKWIKRYWTLAEAIDGHKEILRRVTHAEKESVNA